MEAANVIVLMDEDLLHELERKPANKVLAMMDAASEQVKSALSFIKEDRDVPSELSAMVLFVDDVELLSAIENYGHTNPRTNRNDPDHIYIVHRLSYMPEKEEFDPS